MKSQLTYKGFISYIQEKPDSDLLYGKIEGIEEEITFKAANKKQLQKAFKEAVDDYLFWADSIRRGC